MIIEASGRDDLVQSARLKTQDKSYIVLAGQQFVFDRQQHRAKSLVLCYEVLMILKKEKTKKKEEMVK